MKYYNQGNIWSWYPKETMLSHCIHLSSFIQSQYSKHAYQVLDSLNRVFIANSHFIFGLCFCSRENGEDLKLHCGIHTTECFFYLIYINISIYKCIKLIFLKLEMISQAWSSIALKEEARRLKVQGTPLHKVRETWDFFHYNWQLVQFWRCYLI